VTLNRFPWMLQWVFGLYFIGVGILHLTVPDGLPELLTWMYELNDTLHAILGTVEILGGLGLILPALTRVRPDLAVAAALALIGMMAGALVWHIGRDEGANISANLLNITVLVFIAFGRVRLRPLSAGRHRATRRQRRSGEAPLPSGPRLDGRARRLNGADVNPDQNQDTAKHEAGAERLVPEPPGHQYGDRWDYDEGVGGP